MKDFIFIRDSKEKRVVKINFKDICFIEAVGDYCRINTSSSLKNYILNFRIGKMLNFLDKEIFIRCHSGYIVNINLVSCIQYESSGTKNSQYQKPSIVVGSDKIPLSDGYRRAFLSSINYISNLYELKIDKN